MAQTPGERINLSAALTLQLSYYAAWVPATILIWRFSAGWLPDTEGGWGRIVARHLLIFVTVLVVMTLVTTAVAMPLVQIPGGPSQAFWMQIRGRGYLTLLMYIIVAGGGAAMTLHDRYRERQAAAAALQAELATARLQALRNHLEPHFLFNSLHSIAALARANDISGVVRLTASLGDVLRYVLESGDASARLADEFAIVERYLEIQSARHADRLAVSLTLAPEAAHASVPVLVVQPLVENALKHGLTPRVQAGTLAVSASVRDGRIRIDVEDDGVGLPEGWTMTASRGTGLRNLAARLAAEFGDQAALAVSPRHGGGVLASITFPFTRA
jgi:two-component system, LytTR family, sensor kinase